jgi:hypothetical protein
MGKGGECDEKIFKYSLFSMVLVFWGLSATGCYTQLRPPAERVVYDDEAESETEGYRYEDSDRDIVYDEYDRNDVYIHVYNPPMVYFDYWWYSPYWSFRASPWWSIHHYVWDPYWGYRPFWGDPYYWAPVNYYGGWAYYHPYRTYHYWPHHFYSGNYYDDGHGGGSGRPYGAPRAMESSPLVQRRSGNNYGDQGIPRGESALIGRSQDPRFISTTRGSGSNGSQPDSRDQMGAPIEGTRQTRTVDNEESRFIKRTDPSRLPEPQNTRDKPSKRRKPKQPTNAPMCRLVQIKRSRDPLQTNRHRVAPRNRFRDLPSNSHNKGMPLRRLKKRNRRLRAPQKEEAKNRPAPRDHPDPRFRARHRRAQAVHLPDLLPAAVPVQEAVRDRAAAPVQAPARAQAQVPAAQAEEKVSGSQSGRLVFAVCVKCGSAD